MIGNWEYVTLPTGFMGIIKLVVPFTSQFLWAALARGTRRGFRLVYFDVFVGVSGEIIIIASSLILWLSSVQLITSVLHFASSTSLKIGTIFCQPNWKWNKASKWIKGFKHLFQCKWGKYSSVLCWHINALSCFAFVLFI